jgi:hypothetical protein
MATYLFRGGPQLLKIQVNRKDKKLKIASAKTGHRFRPLPYSALFESEEEQIQMQSLDDTEFDRCLIEAVAKKHGYTFMRKLSS